MGAIVLIPLVCLVLCAGCHWGASTAIVYLSSSNLKKGQHHLQAIWLADAAAQRAVDKLSHPAEIMPGETWALSTSEEIGGAFPGEVIIDDCSYKPKRCKSLTIRASGQLSSHMPQSGFESSASGLLNYKYRPLRTTNLSFFRDTIFTSKVTYHATSH